jgi:hypothetical protein
MAEDILNFLGFSVPFQVDEDQEELVVKGFASVETLDRSRHEVSPLEFNIDTYLNTGALLVNHKRVYDELGNQRTAGRVEAANPVVIESENENGEYVLTDLRDGKLVNTFDKSKVPELKVGDKGLFVTAKVRNKHAVERVKSGELGAFSWRGFTRKRKNADGSAKLRKVDLVEMSLVDMPDHNQSTFSVMKSVDGNLQEVEDFDQSDLEIYKFRFPKDIYDLELVEKYSRDHGLDHLTISENEEYFFGGVRDASLYDTKQTISAPLGDVNVFLAPRLERTHITAELIQEEIPEGKKMSEKGKVEFVSVSKDALSEMLPGVKFDVKKTTTLEDGTEAYILELDTTEVTNEPEQEQASTPAANSDELTQRLLDVITDLGNKVNGLEAKFETIQNPKPEAVTEETTQVDEEEISAEKVENDLTRALEKDLEEREALIKEKEALEAKLSEKEEEVQKSVTILSSFKSITPKTVTREETVEVSKSVNQDSDTVDFGGWFE